jgi:hypothetical protein
MGHFTINLPENKTGDVKSGTSTKASLSLFRKNKIESKNGYLVKIGESNSQTEYRLFKSKDGEWSTDPDGKNPLNNDVLFSIRKAIIEREKELSLK